MTETQGGGLRDLLRPAPPFCCLISIRLPSLELSVLTRLSQDPSLLKAIDAPDPFASLASVFAKVRPSSVCVPGFRVCQSTRFIHMPPSLLSLPNVRASSHWRNCTHPTPSSESLFCDPFMRGLKTRAHTHRHKDDQAGLLHWKGTGRAHAVVVFRGIV